MLTLATATNIAARLESVPNTAWVRIAIGVAALVLLVVLLRKVAKMNKIVLGVIVLLVCTFIGFNWIYERDEPKWATPVVAKIATFFPSKGDLKH
jgi:apolipoprotein N-acyltransferase